MGTSDSSEDPMTTLSTTDSMEFLDSMDVSDDSDDIPLPSINISICSLNIDREDQCEYIISLTFDFLYSFTDDTDVIESTFISIIKSTINSILIPFTVNSDTLNTTVSLYTDPSSGGMFIESTLGINSDTLYTDILD